MTRKEIISLSLKLAGIYCLIIAITQLSNTIQTIAYFILQEELRSKIISINSFVSLLLSFTPFVLLLLFGLYLIFSDELPSKTASLMTQEEKTYSFAFQDIQVLAFSIIGVWLLSTTIPTFIQFIAQIILIHSIYQRSGSVFQNSVYIPQIAAAVLKVALGIYLFSGGKGLIRLWQKFDNTRGS